MNIIIYKGGLGGQLFQYVASQIFATHHNCSIFHNTACYNPIIQNFCGNTSRDFRLPVYCCNSKTGLALLLSAISLKSEPNIITSYDSLFTAKKSFNILFGCFQEQVAFQGACSPIWEDIYLRLKLSSKCSTSKTNSHYSVETTLNVHVSEGGYVDLESTYHSSGKYFFLNAIENMTSQNPCINNIVFFTDSPQWVISNLVVELSHVLDLKSYDLSISVSGALDAFLELCTSHYMVISDSAFGLAAAHIALINYPNRKLIRPSYWFAKQKSRLNY